MASYLPVLLVSVSSNSNDDSTLTTLPRAQVDYLSHQWQEEDVWRSWRNMTKQKNEIANGMRLENASWRTWWKQRNKLKTISPETLNWLKDSDVTWLYGPLHTASEWTPPPRKSTVVPNEHLDLSPARHKPILKYRNLSEFLTSDLPATPVFSPPESDSEGESVDSSAHLATDSSPSRPSLPHTKSDTHITRLGKPNRAFRKDSPPRVEPPSSGLKSSRVYSGTNLNGYFAAHIQAQKSKTPSPSGTDSASQECSGVGGHSRKKSKHITFNTFVEQCIAIDKPKSRSSSQVRSGWDGRTSTKGVNWDVNYQDVDEDELEEFGDERGYDEDVESSDDSDWKRSTDADNEFAICTDSEDSDVDIRPPSNDSDDDEDQEILHLRPQQRRYSSSAPRSHSASSASTASSYSSASTSSSTSDTGSHNRYNASASNRRRLSSASTLRPRRGQSSSSSGSSVASFPNLPLVPAVTTIAPIPPTMLKVGEQSWDGFGLHDHTHTPWLDSFGDDSWSDDGYGHFGNESVELVYVPKTAASEPEEETYHHRGAFFSIGEPDTEMDLGFGQDFFGRSNHRSRRHHERSQLPHGGEEERSESVDVSPLSSSPTPQASQTLVASAPVNIPARNPSPRATSPQAISKSSSSSSLLSPPSRGRSQDPIPVDSPRGRSLTRTPSWTSDRERSRSMGGSSASPLGSLSPDGTGAIASGGVYANGRNMDRDTQRERKQRRRAGASNSVSPEPSSIASQVVPVSESPTATPNGIRTTPTPANSPERSLTARSTPSHVTSKPSSTVNESNASKESTKQPPDNTRHILRLQSPEREGSTIMERVVNSAGSYLGLWQ